MADRSAVAPSGQAYAEVQQLLASASARVARAPRLPNQHHGIMCDASTSSISLSVSCARASAVSKLVSHWPAVSTQPRFIRVDCGD